MQEILNAARRDAEVTTPSTTSLQPNYMTTSKLTQPRLSAPRIRMASCLRVFLCRESSGSVRGIRTAFQAAFRDDLELLQQDHVVRSNLQPIAKTARSSDRKRTVTMMGRDSGRPCPGREPDSDEPQHKQDSECQEQPSAFHTYPNSPCRVAYAPDYQPQRNAPQ